MAKFGKSQIWAKFRGLEPSAPKKIWFKILIFWKNKTFSFWKLWEFKAGLFLLRKALQVMILFSTQICPFLPENLHLHNQKALYIMLTWFNNKKYEYTKEKIWAEIIMNNRWAGLNWNGFQYFPFIFALFSSIWINEWFSFFFVISVNDLLLFSFFLLLCNISVNNLFLFLFSSFLLFFFFLKWMDKWCNISQLWWKLAY